MGKHVHVLSNIRPDLKVADCAGCGPDAAIVFKNNKGSWRCKVGDRRSSPQSGQRRSLKARLASYGLTHDEYLALEARQGGLCAICAEPCAWNDRLAIDHDHTSGRVRGLLCGRCNTALGFMRDRPELLLRAAAYLTTD